MQTLQIRNPSAPQLPVGFAALAIDPQYAPALLTVGCHEYKCGRQAAGRDLLSQLAGLPPGTPDLVDIIDRAGQLLVERHDVEAACALFEAALKPRPDDQVLIAGMGWPCVEQVSKPKRCLGSKELLPTRLRSCFHGLSVTHRTSSLMTSLPSHGDS